MSVLELKHVSKSFQNQIVLDDVSFSIKEHSIFGFIGENGAGKTTTMNIILGLLKKEAGEVYVCGEEVVYGNSKTNNHIGYVCDVPSFYGYMNALEYLKLCGEITNMSKQAIVDKSESLLKMVGLWGQRKKKIASYSRGMKQRLAIAQSLLNEPMILLCDEPTSALDPLGRKEILDILNKVKEKTTILFSTHILSDVERICDEIVILHQGKIKIKGDIDTLKQQYSEQVCCFSCKNESAASQIKNSFASIDDIQIKQDAHTLYLYHEDLKYVRKQIIHIIEKENLEFESISFQQDSLERLFLKVIQND